MGIYPPANDVCQDAAFLFKDRPELIRWVYGEAWETSSVKVWALTSLGVWQIDVRAGVVEAQGSTVKGDERGRWTKAKDNGRGRRAMDDGRWTKGDGRWTVDEDEGW